MHTAQLSEEKGKSNAAPTKTSKTTQWFSLPHPIRRVFNKFPLVTYESNQLPQRACVKRDTNILYIFSISGDVPNSFLSPNPACLKWQAFLLFNKIRFSTLSANNHASPSGSLPFLLPATINIDLPPQAIAASQISRWVANQGCKEQVMKPELEVYTNLIDHNLRRAWLYNLYLDRSNFEHVARPLYVNSASSNLLVQTALQHQLQSAAQDQLIMTSDFIDFEEIYGNAKEAFKALNSLLGWDKFFGNQDRPGLFDAYVFAYTQPILQFIEPNGQGLVWKNSRLSSLLQQYQGLVDHRQRLLDFCKSV